jgi:uncharacterized protein YbaA (DUF1428 family)
MIDPPFKSAGVHDLDARTDLVAADHLHKTCMRRSRDAGTWLAAGGSTPRQLPCRIPVRCFVLGASTHRNKEVPVPYVDGFVIPVKKDEIEAYKAHAHKAGEVWKEHGALDVVECVGDDVPYGKLTSFPRAVQAGADEVVIFSWIVYRSRADRDAVMEKVMADPRLKGDMPFDGKRMIFGGFEMVVQL